MTEYSEESNFIKGNGSIVAFGYNNCRRVIPFIQNDQVCVKGKKVITVI